MTVSANDFTPPKAERSEEYEDGRSPATNRRSRANRRKLLRARGVQVSNWKYKP
jgi:hypothetical protein